MDFGNVNDFVQEKVNQTAIYFVHLLRQTNQALFYDVIDTIKS